MQLEFTTLFNSNPYMTKFEFRFEEDKLIMTIGDQSWGLIERFNKDQVMVFREHLRLLYSQTKCYFPNEFFISSFNHMVFDNYVIKFSNAEININNLPNLVYLHNKLEEYIKLEESFENRLGKILPKTKIEDILPKRENVVRTDLMVDADLEITGGTYDDSLPFE